MSNSLPDPQASGFKPPETQRLDFNEAPIIRQRTSVIDRAYSTAAGALAADGGSSAALPPDLQPAPEPVYVAPPAQAPAPLQQAAVPLSTAAPVDNRYPPRANDRINKLYGEMRNSQEYSAALETKLAENNARLDALLSREQARPYTNQHNSSSGFDAQQAGTPAAGQPLSRQELQTMLAQERQETIKAFATMQSHNASRADAVRDYPEVFSDPNLAADADRIWSSERWLQSDPNGPYKAAALARGLRSEIRPANANGAFAAVQKEALAGVGVSVPEGSGQTASRESRYQAAIDRARTTQNLKDFVLARNIQLGHA